MSIQSARKAILEFFTEEDGATAVEYSIMLALIVVVCFSSITAVADNTGDSFNTSGAAIAGAFGR
jgi:Flp pilus assembly pilin Flp